MKISVCDTTICDDNLGNQIIMDGLTPVIDRLFRDAFIIRLQYLEPFGAMSRRHLRESEYVFFGGTNALSSQMNRYSQMGFSLRDAFRFHNLVLVGVGWWQYQKPPNVYTRTLLKRLLHPEAIHSVRDDYSRRYLESIGIRNVVNTSCPSAWMLTPEHCAGIPAQPGAKAICTLTDYHQNPNADRAFLNLVLERYESCYLWLQGAGDRDYFDSLQLPAGRVTLIPSRLDAYDAVLREQPVDYIGTRLHAGIRALQHRRRSLILAIDNRSAELGKDIGLQTCDRADIDAVRAFIEGRAPRPDIRIPLDAIQRWQRQFA
jgi:hypothetical protein